MQDYRKLRIWQRAHQMAVDAYSLPKYLNKPEAWPLRDQIPHGHFNPVQHRGRCRTWFESRFQAVLLAFDGIVQ